MQLTVKQQMITLTAMNMSEKEKWAYLMFIRQHNLINKTATLQECIEISRYLTQSNQQFTKCQWQDLDLEVIVKAAESAIMWGEEEYPTLWYQIPKPPIIVFYQGNLSLLQRPCVSIVGSRKITPYGQKMTEQLVKAMIKRGWICVSGMALGVDATVHTCAMNHMQYGATIGVIATGLNRCYPKCHQEMQQKLSQQHLLLSEYWYDVPPLKHHFIMRNRLVAGLVPVLCVMQAAKKSGSLITANYALQFNREVYALPGPIDCTQSEGCNALIAAGAAPIVAINDVINEIDSLFSMQKLYI